ncbi:MAG TPA: prepilin-type N-terminal cleavage/methylation domain-containing protein [Longimicrobiales bacterium]
MLSNRKGFTLIELLIVVVIIGILAAIAIPKFSATREKAYFSAMKSDLKNLQASQEIYYSDGSYEYSADEDALDFSESNGSNVDITVGGSGTQWWAKATHDALAGASQYCEVFVNYDTAPTAAATEPGVVTCTGE